MAEAAKLMEKYQNANKDASLEIRTALLSFQPQFTNTEHASVLNSVKLGEAAEHNKRLLEQRGVAQNFVNCVRGSVEQTNWILTVLYDMLREDSSSFGIFESGNIGEIFDRLNEVLVDANAQEYTADKAAWVLSAIMGNVPDRSNEAGIRTFASTLQSKANCSQVGKLDAICNLLKADAYRKAVWETPGVAECILKVQPATDSQQLVYRCVFAIWMLSFDATITADLSRYEVILKMKTILNSSRAEKVIRLSLTVLKNLLAVKVISEEIAEAGLLEAVQQLEYEKWRDAELYDEIRDTAQNISLKVQEISNFERYEKELQSGKLQWGFIHSSKFWSENVNKFETNDFRAIKHLAELLNNFQTDKTTLAVCCHDIGEFVTLHPLGKRKIAGLHIKERVMKLMSSTDDADREVRREALLCCQKIMLNKWQDVESAK